MEPRAKEGHQHDRNVQRRAMKMIPGLKDLSYPEWLRALKLPTLVYRRLRGDMIETYKVIRKVYDTEAAPIMPMTGSGYGSLHSSVTSQPKTIGHFTAYQKQIQFDFGHFTAYYLLCVLPPGCVLCCKFGLFYRSNKKM